VIQGGDDQHIRGMPPFPREFKRLPLTQGRGFPTQG
jgi:hypothetical protein